ncbi:hypothetical protein FisN_5Lh007 [Fistulifera solaris]|uniref:VWFA domain-containing protein n=1 Tax=Fistulifera solaris TaxID=1519565 RepID=A0A1Z5JJG6_FISSO|nr:hypothetical protein FisN_5Lh007 [Fistulifera solaris]|eukprot:GAX14066.1 hypothetical protein FisN_5Lh007 [Fistulifera solaris]
MVYNPFSQALNNPPPPASSNPPPYNPAVSMTAATTSYTGSASSTPPKKYVRIDGVMKLNPEFKKWKEATEGKPATTVANANVALPVVTNMEDHEALNEASVASGGKEFALSESTNATIEMMQEPEISMEAGMQPDTMVDELGSVLNKYEVPMGLMNKLMMLSEFEVLEFMVDDSGSMTLLSDTLTATKQTQTRWQEAHARLKEMLEILAYVPFQEIQVCFLNRPDRVSLKRLGRDPKSFLVDAYRQIDACFQRGPMGGTPVFEKLQESFAMGANRSIARYLFCDGTPNGGLLAKEGITKLLINRLNPAQNPMTFLSCSDTDAEVEWMKDVEEVAPYCSECDDFADEAAEVLRDQGMALPFTKGFYLICSLVAASSPEDLDAMDESVPFTKTTLDNLLGVNHDEASYKHYFDHFMKAQHARVVENDDYGRPKKADQLKKNQNWRAYYSDFVRVPVANQIPAVQTFKQQLKQAEG